MSPCTGLWSQKRGSCDRDESNTGVQVARVTVSADAGFLPPVIDFVEQVAQQAGLEDTGR